MIEEKAKVREKKIRLIAYVSDDMKEWVEKESKKLGMTESTFVRFALLCYKKKGA